MNVPSLDSGLSRRALLNGAGGGFGLLALAQLLSAEQPVSTNDLVVRRRSHHRPRVQRVIQLFMNGGASAQDTFDYKPRLGVEHGRRFDPGAGQLVESVTGSPGFKVLKSPFTFARHGACGRWVSSELPHMAKIVDKLAFLMSMVSPTNVHGLASYIQNTGFTQPGFPCLGAWVSYGLGRLTDNLPTFVVLPDPRGLPYNNRGNFSSAFLPAEHQGTVIKANAREPIAALFPPKNPAITRGSEQDGLSLLRTLNTIHGLSHPGDSRFSARMESYELAARMQLSAPEVFRVDLESPATQRSYGVSGKETDDFARRLIVARRMLERGVRFVQVWSGAGGPKNNWDNHTNIRAELPYMARKVDQPIAALVRDLEARGMLDDTLVVWTTEFGRMPFSQGQEGRDHNGGSFVTWLAGGGIRAGSAFGESDDWGWKARTPIPCYDLHATVLHLLGIDHERLTVRHNGIERRLTDVHGRVIDEILA